MLRPRPEQVLPRLFWPACFLSLAFGLVGWSYLVLRPADLTQHWLRNPASLKVVHSLALGQLGLLFLGVGAQALPVLFHQAQSNRGISGWGQGLWAAGVLLLLAFMAGWRHAAVLLPALAALGFGWGLLNLQARAVAGSGQSRSFAWDGLGPAFLYLGLQVLLGAALSVGLLTPVLPQDPLLTLQLHAHLGLWGFAALAIFGFLPKLLRLFQASSGYAGWPLRWAFKAVHLGLALLLARWLGWAGAWAPPLAGLSLLAAALLWCAQLLLLLRAAKARRFESSLSAQMLGAFFLLGAAALDAWLLAGNGGWREQAACVALGLGGFVGLVLQGTLQRVCAVLGWYQRFYEAAKTHSVPTAWGLIPPSLAWSAGPLQALAVLCLAAGLWLGDATLIRWAGIGGCLAQLATVGIALAALTRGNATPFPDGQNPFATWAEEESGRA